MPRASNRQANALREEIIGYVMMGLTQNLLSEEQANWALHNTMMRRPKLQRIIDIRDTLRGIIAIPLRPERRSAKRIQRADRTQINIEKQRKKEEEARIKREKAQSEETPDERQNREANEIRQRLTRELIKTKLLDPLRGFRADNALTITFRIWAPSSGKRSARHFMIEDVKYVPYREFTIMSTVGGLRRVAMMRPREIGLLDPQNLISSLFISHLIGELMIPDEFFVQVLEKVFFQDPPTDTEAKLIRVLSQFWTSMGFFAELVDVTIHNAPVEREEPQFEFLDQPLEDSMKCTAAMSKYLDYKLNPNAAHIEELIELPQSAESNACGYDLIISQWGRSIKKCQNDQKPRYTDIEISYAGLFKFFHGREYKPGDSLALTLRQIERFCEKIKTGFRVFDVNGRLQYKFTPSSYSKNIYPRNVHFMVHNRHIYIFNDNIKSLEMRVAKMSLEELEVDDAPPKSALASYNIPTGMTYDIFAFTSKDLLKITQMELDPKVPVFVRILYVADGGLADLLLTFLKMKYEPSVSLTTTKQIKKITFKANGSTFSISDPRVTDHLIEQEFETEEYYKRVAEFDKGFRDALINAGNISFYSPTIRDVLTTYKRSALNGYFIKPDLKKTYTAVDMAKCYPAMLKTMQFLPRFNVFDDFIPFKAGSTILEYAIYFVRVISFELDQVVSDPDEDVDFEFTNRKIEGIEIVLDRAYSANGQCYNFLTGYTIEMHKMDILPRIEIIAVAEPSHLVPNLATAEIQKVLSSDLHTADKKHILVKEIGMLGKCQDSKSSTKMFYDRNEAEFYAKETGGSLDVFTFGARNSKLVKELSDYDGHIYFVKTDFHRDLVNGFLPIHFHIYDRNRAHQFAKYKELTEKGRKVVGIKTDCLYIEGSWRSKQEFDRNAFENIGRFSFVPNQKCPTIPLRERHSKSLEVLDPETRMNRFQLRDEFDQVCFNETANKFDRMLVLAEMPGSGKTTAGVNHFATKKTPCLIICPYNKQCAELRDSLKERGITNISVRTLYNILGIRVSNDQTCEETMSTSEQKAFVSQFSHIMFDEIFAYNIGDLAKIKSFMDRHSGVRYLANGDIYQNEPINDALSVSDRKAYYKRAVESMFCNILNLRINKRHKSKADRETIAAIKEDLMVNKLKNSEVIGKYNFQTITNLSEIPNGWFGIGYRNETTLLVNKEMHGRRMTPSTAITVNGIAFYPRLEVVCRKYLRISRKKDDVINTYVNYTYRISKIDSRMVTLVDVFDEVSFEMPCAYLEHFSLPYAGTGHSTQGLTIDSGIVICEATFKYTTPEWFYTAITRNRDLSQILIYTPIHKFERKSDYMEYLKAKVRGYKAQDQKAGRAFDEADYITADWILEKKKEQKGACAICSLPIPVEPKDKQLVLVVDRIDNKRAHVKDNCQLAHHGCNCSKK